MKSLSVERPHTSKTYGKDESPIFTPVNNAKVSWQKSPQLLLNSNIKSRANLFKTARFSNDINKKLAKKLDNIEYGFPEKETTTRSAHKAKTPLSESASIYMRTAETFLSNGVERTEYDTLSSFKDLVNSKKINQRGILERSYKISQLRKKTDDGLRPEKPKSALKNSYSSAKLSSDKTLTRFVDQLILAGSLPLEAVEYFSPESAKNKTEKSPTSATHSNKPSISIKSPRNQSKESKPETPAVDIIPRWLRAFPKFGNSVGAKKKNAQNPIFRILTRNPNERDLAQVTFIAKWLSNIQIFSKLHYDKLVELGKVLEPVYLNEGEILCNIGDQADCAYIVYEGQIEIYTKPVDIERWIGKAGAGEVLGKQALEQAGRRTAKLMASKPTYVVALGRQNYKNVLGETKPVESASNSLIYSFVTSHDFLKTFSEVKKHMLTNHLTLQKYLKNEVVYHMEAPADRLFMVMSGKVVRRMPVTIDKANKWPTGLQDWRICKIIKTYSVTLPIQVGEIFGVSEMIDVAKRKEQVLIDEDAQILTLTRDAFYQIFEEEDVFKFQKKVHEDDRKKAEKIKRMFEQQEKLHKIKTVAMADAFNFSLNNRNFSSFREVTEKTAEWKKLEKGMTQVKSRDKVVVSVQEIIKDVHSVYET